MNELFNEFINSLYDINGKYNLVDYSRYNGIIMVYFYID